MYSMIDSKMIDINYYLLLLYDRMYEDNEEEMRNKIQLKLSESLSFDQ